MVKRVAGIIGFPVSHSRSPALHHYWLAHYGVAGAYLPFPVKPGYLEPALRGLAALGMCGANITVPHKEAALPLMDYIDATARQVGAVNLVVVREDGTLEGRNSDVYGFTHNLLAAGQAWQPTKPALVVGAGGAARAVVVALLQAGCETVYLTNRTPARAEQLAEQLTEQLAEQLAANLQTTPARIIPLAWEARHQVLPEIFLLVNTTTQGMESQPALDLSLATLNKAALVTDLVYTPLHTPLLQEAQQRQLAWRDGLGMLLHQAVPAFAAWFGHTPTVTPTLRQQIEATL